MHVLVRSELAMRRGRPCESCLQRLRCGIKIPFILPASGRYGLRPSKTETDLYSPLRSRIACCLQAATIGDRSRSGWPIMNSRLRREGERQRRASSTLAKKAGKLLLIRSLSAL